ncbi:hypothetical protein [Roseicella aquatilis]|uniref:Uncharacterized protein n=1 Tax=Roseicella aquatilis TaxID=2527868 RepID=A0A4R4DQQ0_9PROT|nr:hypothetical protein [Roseicella aquatilis]TCZ64449.1 hypothetical protein EXY23_07325 [Roseicella aquatilis]
MITTTPETPDCTRTSRFRLFPSFFMEWNGGRSVFVRIGRVEVWAAPDLLGEKAWHVLREPGAVEVAIRRYRVIVSRAPIVSARG